MDLRANSLNDGSPVSNHSSAHLPLLSAYPTSTPLWEVLMRPLFDLHQQPRSRHASLPPSQQLGKCCRHPPRSRSHCVNRVQSMRQEPHASTRTLSQDRVLAFLMPCAFLLR